MLRKKTLFAILALLSIVVGTCLAQSLREKALQHFEPLPVAIPSVKGNDLSTDKVALGKMLFFEPRLSASGLFSCNTCHNLGMGGDDNLPTSVGHDWQRGPRNTPTVFNAALNETQCWDGRVADLKEQTKRVVRNGIIMNSSSRRILATLNSMPEYVEWFGKAFPGQSEPISMDNMAGALEAFEAGLLTPGSRFDQWLEGGKAVLNEQELAGLGLFIEKDCVRCHSGINLGGQAYYPFGVVERPGSVILPIEDKGRFAVTQTASDEYVFRAPSLRNVALTAPYFHSGRVWSLKHAVAVMGAFQVGVELSDADEEAITAFLGSLTGRQPQITYPLLPPSTAKTPKPLL